MARPVVDQQARERSSRLLEIIRMLSGSPAGLTVRDLVEALGETRGTIRYDLDLLTYIVEIYEEGPGQRRDGRGRFMPTVYRIDHRRLPASIEALLWPEPG